MKKIEFLKRTSCALLLGACLGTTAVAKVSEQEAARLGNDLTPFGAEMAGNAAGTIPAWSGGLAATPNHVRGDRHADPFAADKVLYSVTAQNMDQYIAHLPAGQVAMLKKYPDSYRLDIYPTRRSHSAPQKVYDHIKVNATRAELVEGGNGIDGAFGGIPFPIPKTGQEVIWNHLFRWAGEGAESNYNGYIINEDGGLSKVTGGDAYEKYPAYIGNSIEDFNGEIWNIMVNYQRPTRRKGEVVLLRDPVNQDKEPRKGWQYLVGQRRVRRAPTIAYDSPNAGFSGLATYDDAFIFNGAIDRYDWKLVGKKELYLPYNSYKGDVYLEDPTVLYTAKNLNPDYVRWELHRTWVIEATLKEGKRHVYGKRTFYLDEDSWVAALSDSYDGRGTLWRTSIAQLKNMTELPGIVQRLQVHYDLNKGQYAVNNCQTEEKKITRYGEAKPASFFTPEQIRRMGRR
jgi:hypothetical protein